MFLNLFAGEKVFLTGHTGFKGTWLTLWLQALGAKVTGYSIDIPTKPSMFESVGLSNRVRTVWGDINDREALLDAMAQAQPKFVFHLAAQPLVRQSYETPLDTFQTNVIGTLNLLEAVRKVGTVKTVIVVTTDKVYENLEWSYSYRENDKLGGSDPYSASKACAEIATASYIKSFFKDPSSPRIATVRAGNVIGGGDWAVDRIVPDCIRAWMANETLKLRNPIAVRPWQHVLEPLGGYLWLTALMAEESGDRLHGESFNFGPRSAGHASVHDLVVELTQHLEQLTTEEQVNDGQKKESQLLMLNCEKAFMKLGWSPRWDFGKTLEMTASWYSKCAAQVDSTELFDLSLAQIKAYDEELRQLWSRRS